MVVNDKIFEFKKPSSKNTRVGQAVYDILSKAQEMQEVGETIDAMTPRYYEELLATIDNNKDKLDPPFYIIVLRKKEPWALNVLRQWYIARQTKPSAKYLRELAPNHDQDVWEIDPRFGKMDLKWTLPTEQDSKTILKNKHMYHEDIVRWIQEFNAGILS